MRNELLFFLVEREREKTVAETARGMQRQARPHVLKAVERTVFLSHVCDAISAEEGDRLPRLSIPHVVADRARSVRARARLLESAHKRNA